MEQPIWQVLLLLLLGAAVVQGVVLVAVMRQVGGILIQVTPPRPGALEGGPEIGSVLELPDDVKRGKPAIILFAAPNCAPCQDLMPSVPVAARSYRAIQFVTVITGRDEDERRAYAKTIDGVEARPDLHFLQAEWRIPGTPYAVGLDEDGRVLQAGVVNHLEHLEALAEAVFYGQPHTTEPATDGSLNGNRGAPELATASSTTLLEGPDVRDIS